MTYWPFEPLPCRPGLKPIPNFARVCNVAGLAGHPSIVLCLAYDSDRRAYPWRCGGGCGRPRVAAQLLRQIAGLRSLAMVDRRTADGLTDLDHLAGVSHAPLNLWAWAKTLFANWGPLWGRATC